MSQIVTQHFSFSEIQRHPGRIVELLAQEGEIVIVVKRQGADITICSYPVYSQEVNDILNDAMADHQRKQQQGYPREQAFQDFQESQQAISRTFTGAPRHGKSSKDYL